MKSNKNKFDKFPIGCDEPGVRHFHDKSEETWPDMDPGTEKEVTYYFNSNLVVVMIKLQDWQ